MHKDYTKTGYPLFSKLYLLMAMAVLLNACGSSDDPNPGGEFASSEFITGAEFLGTTSENTIRAIASAVPGFSAVVSVLNLNSVDAHKIVYKTVDVDGNETSASGLLMYPAGAGPIPVLSYQHGTIYDNADAPSNFAANSEVTVALVMASTGYALILPDYLGFGESSNLLHPYEHGKTLGSASYHMLMASREFFEIRNIATTSKLFLTGYSEGGYATMALHKHIEENSNLEVTMSAPAAGAHNKTAFTLEIMSLKQNLTFLPNYMWVLHSYNWIYGINRPWSSYVNTPHDTALDGIANPMNLRNAQIALNPQELFRSDLIEGLNNGTETQLLAAIADNNLFDWTPRAPITLYHGSNDDFVFPLNSRTAFESLKANGANVQLVEFPGKDHGSAVTDYVVNVFALFESLK